MTQLVFGFLPPDYMPPAMFGEPGYVAPLPPALPNTRRRIVVQDDVSDYVVENFFKSERDAITFDFSHRLSPATPTDAVELIATISFDIAAAYPYVDPLQTAYVQGAAGFEESLVSQTFGAWRMLISYRVLCKITTTRGNIVTAAANFSILPDPS